MDTTEFAASKQAGTRWIDNGTSSGQATTTLGGSGGVVSWSLAGAGWSNNTGGTFFSGTSVSLASFLPFDYEAVLRSAFDAWAAVANIEFIEIVDGGGNFGATTATSASIRIGAGYIDGQAGSTTLAYGYFPSSVARGGDIAFDSSNTNFFANSHNFFITALHEIGHALGLDHEPASPSGNVAVMNPIIDPSMSGLQTDDINGIRTVYGAQDFGANAYYMPSSQLNMTILDSAPSLFVVGNASSNTIIDSAASDTVYGQDGNDTILGGEGNDSLFGGTGVDTLVGEGGNDMIYGNEQTDYIDGRQGNDQLSGGDGIDVIFGDGLTSTYGFGSDTIHGDDGDDILMGESGTHDANGAGDIIYGDAGNDQIFGGGGNDLIYGGAGADVIDGGEGSDFIVGGTGADILVGSADSRSVGGPAATTGGDLFSYSNINDGGDVIYGFDMNFATAHDGIDLSSLFASLGYSGHNPRADGYLYVFQNGANTDIYVDANGFQGGVQLSHMATLDHITATSLTNDYFLT